ncbi:MAG: sulfatase [Thermoanaerobaculia bacterium]|nr:sulfatase [Thermoanaerobaculia bacterium]
MAPVGIRRGRAATAALAALLALAAAGCGREPAEPEPAPGPPLADREIGAAIQKIGEAVDRVPLPPIGMPQAPGVLRLNDRLADAEVVSEWQPDGREGEILASFGPLSTRAPGPGVEVAIATARRSRVKWLVLSGFEVPAERVGQIAFEAAFQGATRFLLSWDRLNFLEIGVREGADGAGYTVQTDGLNEFEGVLTRIRLGVVLDPEAAQTPEIDLASLELRARTAIHPLAAGVERVRLGDVLRTATYLRGGTRVEYRGLPLPPGARLSFGAAVLQQPLDLRVLLRRAGGEVALVEQTVADASGWRSGNHALEAEGTVDLVLEAVGPAERVLYLADPTIYAPHESPPRVFLYLVDTLGARHMSLHGYPRRTTPFLERLAAEGACFDNAFANSAWTPESAPSLLTSLHAPTHGVVEDFSRLAPELVTLAEAFSAAGWATASFSTNGNAGPARALDQGFDSFFDHIARASERGELRTVPVASVLPWLREHRDRPTLVYVHTAEPHDPYEPPPPWDTLFDPEYAGPADGSWRPNAGAFRRGRIDPRDLEHLVALYDGEVAFADRMIEAFFGLLDDRGYLENALFAVTADHGEAFGEKGIFGHGVHLYPEVVRVPLLFWGPGTVRPGRHAQNVQLLDVMPTLLDLAGIGLEAPLQGASLAGLLRGGRAPDLDDRPILLAQHAKPSPRLALVEGRWKLQLDTTLSFAPYVALYDLLEDPDEENDLASRHPGRARDMLRRLVLTYAGLPRYDVGLSTPYQIDQQQIDRLKALGYL